MSGHIEDDLKSLRDLLDWADDRAGRAAEGHALSLLRTAASLELVARRLKEHVVPIARHEGATWAQVGDATRTSKQGAQQRYGASPSASSTSRRA